MVDMWLLGCCVGLLGHHYVVARGILGDWVIIYLMK